MHTRVCVHVSTDKCLLDPTSGPVRPGQRAHLDLKAVGKGAGWAKLDGSPVTSVEPIIQGQTLRHPKGFMGGPR